MSQTIFITGSSTGLGRATGPEGAPSALFRLPLDGAPPSAIKTVGAPIDQLSFLEEPDHLNVLLRASGAGDAMFGDGRGAGGTALLRLPLQDLGDGRKAAALQHYRAALVHQSDHGLAFERSRRLLVAHNDLPNLVRMFEATASAVVLSCVLGLLLGYLVLPMEIGVWWYVYPREATAAK